MRKTIFSQTILTAAMVLWAGLAFCVNWSGQGYTVVETKEELGRKITVLKGSDDATFTVSAGVTMTDRFLIDIKRIHTALTAIKSMKVKTLKFVVSSRGVEAVVIPDTFTYESVDIVPHVPAGLFFFASRDGLVRYNFRLTKDNIFVRIKGQFVDEKSLCAKLLEAIKNPEEYARRRDPDYFLAQLDKLKENISQLKGNISQLKISQKNYELEQKRKAGEIRAEYLAFQKEFANLRGAVMHLHNRGFFGNVVSISQGKVQKIIDMKKRNFSLTNVQIAQKLREQKITVSDNEVFVVVAAYFNDYK